MRSVPFTTKRATFSEVQRVYEKLSTVIILEKGQLEQEVDAASHFHDCGNYVAWNNHFDP